MVALLSVHLVGLVDKPSVLRSADPVPGLTVGIFPYRVVPVTLIHEDGM